MVRASSSCEFGNYYCIDCGSCERKRPGRRHFIESKSDMAVLLIFLVSVLVIIGVETLVG